MLKTGTADSSICSMCQSLLSRNSFVDTIRCEYYLTAQLQWTQPTEKTNSKESQILPELEIYLWSQMSPGTFHFYSADHVNQMLTLWPFPPLFIAGNLQSRTILVIISDFWRLLVTRELELNYSRFPSW